MSARDEGDTASQRSGASSGTGGKLSETSSQQSDAKFLRRRALRAQHEGTEETDVLEQRRNLQEGVFSCMYTLVRQSALSQLAFAALKVVLEGLMNFIVAFNPSFKVWKIDTSSPVWQVVRWTVWRSPIMRLYGYRPYVIVMYVMAAAVLLAVVGLVWLTLAMRKQEQSKALRMAASLLHVVFDIVFIMCYVSFFDYFVFMADCDFLGSDKVHLYFTGVMCLEMPHLLHMLVGLTAAALFLVVTALLVVASAELNPVSLGYLATPAALVRLRILFAKAAYIVLANCLDSSPRVQCLGMTASVTLILFWNFRGTPFYRRPINAIWTGLWGGILYTCVVLDVAVLGKDQSVARHRQLTQLVLYGIFPSVLVVMALTSAYLCWAVRPARKFRELPPGSKLSKVHKFESVYEVELLARVVRKFDRDGLVEESAAALGETIIKAGLQAFPNAPHLLILYANFVLEVRKDGPSARTHLQLAAKHAPNIIQRYQIFCTYEASKRLKGSQEEGMDLQAYIEFKRNFRAVLRVHREVLMMQAEIWQLCMRSSLAVKQFDDALDSLEAAAARANQVYKRVLERYPNNGKLLRCYGKFLEDARHDHVSAVKAYTEANRSGAGGALLSLDLSSGLHGGDKPEFLASMSMDDDAVVVIDAEGTIMMVSQAVQRTFGYTKFELEGANVSMLMPQPFSQRHDSYLQRFIATGEAHILDSVREVVALHKDRYVFPVALCVTKLSGIGTDSIFLGVVRPLPPDIHNVRAWVAPNGVFLCSDQQFASAVGSFQGELVGHPLTRLVAAAEAAEALLERCKAATAAELAAGNITTQLLLKHRYGEPVPVHVTVRLAGTDGQRIIALQCRRTDGQEGSMMAVDTHMRVKFASCEVALLLGYSMRKLATMRLDQLLPPPFSALHAKWLRDPPHVIPSASCRSGAVVHLQSESGAQIPVRLQIDTLESSLGAGNAASSTTHVVQIHKVAAEALFAEKRLVLSCDFSGRVLMVSPPASTVFGFPAYSLVGVNLAECVDIFADWQQRSGEAQMQLILLALLYKEQEMPGTSWRVRVSLPEDTQDDVAGLPSLKDYTRGGGKARIAVSACLQVEMQEEAEDKQIGSADSAGEHEPRIRITLWRRDLLSGVVELDEELVIRRASPLTGLITGIPTSAMLRKPLNRYVNLPTAASWEKLVAASAGQHSHGHHKKSALKATQQHGCVSPVMAFIGPHPDSGTMRLMVQGVQTLGPGGRPKITLTIHPDTTFLGAHANLMRVLKLDEGASGRVTQCGAAGGGNDDSEFSVAAVETRSRMPSAVPSSRATRKTKSRKQPQPHQSTVDAADAADEGSAVTGAAGASATKDLVGSGGAEGAGAASDDREQGRRNCSSGGDGVVEGGQGAFPSKQHGKAANDPDSDDDDSDIAPGAVASLHRQATSKSEFVAQWVRTLSHQVSGLVVTGPAEQQQKPSTPVSGGCRESEQAMPVKSNSARMGVAAVALPDEGGVSEVLPALEAGLKPLSSPPAGADQGSLLARVTSLREWGDPADAGRRGGSLASGEGKAAATSRRTTVHDEAEKRAVDDAKGEKAPSESGESSTDGSQAAGSIVSSATGVTSISEYVIDARRGRLLKSLSKLLMGPAFIRHIDRLRLQSYALIAIMFIAHVISYSIITGLIKQEHTNVYSVHRQAMAMDRSQLVIVRCIAGAFCERANVTEKVSICANTLNMTISKLRTNVALMEEYHQGVYLGFDTSAVTKLEKSVYDIWTQHDLNYQVFLDTTPPQVIEARAGAWQLGNRFIAAAREAVYLLPKLRDEFKLHRTYQFIKANGLGAMFEGYATSLDLLVDAAWLSIAELKRDLLITLIVEAVVVQLCCTCYELYLVQRTEWVRLLGVLAMLGLPGPVLRQLANFDTRIIDDSDDESDKDDDDSRGGEDEVRGAHSGTHHVGGGDPDDPSSRAAMPLLPAAQLASAAALASGALVSADGGDKPLFEAARRAAAEEPLEPSDEPLRPSSAARVHQKQQYCSLREEDEASNSRSKPDSPAQVAAGSAGDKRILVDNFAHAASVAGKLQAGLAAQRIRETTVRVMSPSKGIEARESLRRSRSSLQINGKTLSPSIWNVSKFMAPFFVWNAAVIVVYAVSLMKLDGMQGPLASLNMASHVTYRYTRVRAFGAAFVTQDDAASRDFWRPLLINELGLFTSEYNAVMYGGEPTSMAKSTFRRVVPAGTFASSSFAQAFFRSKTCFRYDKSACFPPGHEYYEVTHNGLDVMVRRMLSEMYLLAADADQDLAYNGTRYTFMAMVGANDLYEGLQQAAELFVNYSISRYNEVAMLHTILLIVSVGLVLGFFAFVLWPHIRRLLRDAARLGALLSMVPPETDVRAHVRTVLRRAAGKVLKSAAASQADAAAATVAAKGSGLPSDSRAAAGS